MRSSPSLDKLMLQYSKEIAAADEETKRCEENKNYAVNEKASCDDKQIAISTYFFKIDKEHKALSKELTEYFQQLKGLFDVLARKSLESKVVSNLDGKLKLNMLHCLFKLMEDEAAKFSKLIGISPHPLKELTLSEEIMLNANLRDLCKRVKDVSLQDLFEKINGLRLIFIKEPIHKSSFTF